MTYLDRLLDVINRLPDFIIYLVLGFSSFLENVFPPAPGDTIIAFGAFLVGIERLHFAGVYLSTCLGSLAGFMFLFWVGTFLDRRFLIKRDYRYFRAEQIIRAERWFKQYGYFLVLINRFIPGIRSVISIVGGISRLQALKVLLLALLSCSAWNLIWIALGYSVGSNWETAKARITTILSSYNLTMLVLAGFFILFLLVRKWLNRSK